MLRGIGGTILGIVRVAVHCREVCPPATKVRTYRPGTCKTHVSLRQKKTCHVTKCGLMGSLA